MVNNNRYRIQAELVETDKVNSVKKSTTSIHFINEEGISER